MVKRCKPPCCCVLVILGMTSVTYGQLGAGLNFIMAYNPMDSVKAKGRSAFTFNDTNESRVAAMGLIRLYQLFISSQDMPVCNFTPSCSRFGMEALRRYGVFHGILMTSDRLQRCHGVGRKYYAIHSETGKSDDPVEHNLLW